MTYDAIVIGGGLAGGTAAYHLAQKRYRVLVLEKQTGPHHKVCGEFLSGETRGALQDMGLDLSGAPDIRRLIIASRMFETGVDLPLPGLGLSRYRMDHDLLTCAAEKGADIRRGVTVHSYQHADGRFRVRTDTGEYVSGAIFLATGKHDLRGDTHRDTVARSAIGFKMHLRLQTGETPPRPSGSVGLYPFRGGYVGLCDIEDGNCNLCLIVDSRRYKDVGARFDLLLEAIGIDNPRLARVMQSAEMAWTKPVSVSNVPYGYLGHATRMRSVAPGLYYVGDQFAVIPSLTGSGMSIALSSARAAVEGFDCWKETGASDGRPYALQQPMSMADRLHRLPSSPLLCEAVVGLLKICPPLARRLVTGTRVP